MSDWFGSSIGSWLLCWLVSISQWAAFNLTFLALVWWNVHILRRIPSLWSHIEWYSSLGGKWWIIAMILHLTSLWVRLRVRDNGREIRYQVFPGTWLLTEQSTVQFEIENQWNSSNTIRLKVISNFMHFEFFLNIFGTFCRKHKIGECFGKFMSWTPEKCYHM